ncbi:CLUSTERED MITOCHONDRIA PROTEIN-like protein [Salix koriyanagi]|uniref:CLUSTERED MITOCHONDRIA PROTEIN-like protein n=1 Tax=Salix koriyanagi TaxID=2511006 RepID=A0A9Q0TR06_9ROSI|nr:CLUSTERED MITOCHONDRIA PROTEIN-like protein [Salix koriyanagi]
MAGKSNKGRNRRGSNSTTNSSEPTASSNAPVKDDITASEAASEVGVAIVNGAPAGGESTNGTSEIQESETASSTSEAKQGDLHLYPVSVKTQSNEKLELQLNPGDSVMDLTLLLVVAPWRWLPHLMMKDRSGLMFTARENCFHSLHFMLHLSTSLALEYEKTQNKALGSDTGKTEVPELEGMGFMEDVAGSVGELLSFPTKEITCVDNIIFSSFNPPPSHRRLVGDLIYLDVVTLEGNKCCITGTTKMFYVNSSTGNVLDPRPSKATSEATTLVGLLQKISPKFKKALREILEHKGSAHPFENVQTLLPPCSWLGLYPVPDHRRDAARAEDALTLSYGSELIGMQRDWNEELQSCREFPHSTPQERILRDRALYKVTSDFVDAATKGAIGVINRCIPPINPTDPECFHMYVHNNIFFSFAVDVDLELLSKKCNSDTSSKMEKASSSINSSEKVTSDVHGDGGIAHGVKSDGSTIEVVELHPKSSSEPQLAESEQATYASANNDLKGTKAYQEADVPGLYNLAMAIIDYRGHRVVAQSVLPGILQGDKSDSLLYDFHSKVVEAAKRLHLKEHTVQDGSGNAFKLAAPVECKGIVGSDDRHYLLDLMRATPRDANYTGPGSRFCILRPELISAFCQAEAVARLKSIPKSEGGAHLQTSINDQDIAKEGKADTVEESAAAPARTSESCEEILFNPNVFTEFKLSGDPEEIAADEENVKKVGSYLANTVVPKFTQDLCTLEVSPMDGQTLTEALHAHGINVRYMGKVAEGIKHLPHLWDLCSNEIVVRSAKHILKDLLRDTDDNDLGPAISHFFNCFFGSCQAVGTKVSANGLHSRATKKEQSGNQSSGKSSRGQTRWKGASARKNQSSYMNVSSEILWSDIQELAVLKYQFELPEDARSHVKKVSVIRNLCQKMGITIAARKYDLNAAMPFQLSDILNIQPVVKHSVPLCSEAKDIVETGKVQLAEGMLSEAYTSFSEAFSILQQVTGPMHREVANCCRYLAMVLYHAGDMAGAIIQQHKELIINERCLGLDHPDTAHSYGNMALFYHGLNQTELALRHMSRALLLLSLSSGPDHPDVAATFINVAMMYQDIGKMNTALRYLQEALKKNERLLGEDHIQTAVCYHALAIAFNCMGAFKLSHQHEKKTYDILVKQLGEEDSRTRDSQNWMKTFKMRELQKQKGQALNAASAQKAIDILKANPDLLHAFQAAAVAGGSGSGSSSGSMNKSLNAAIVGETLPRGRGVDERAARAAEEVRKKAAARGLLIRPNGVPVQALPPLTQLLNIINSGATPDTVNSEEAAGGMKETKGQSSNDSVDTQKDQTSGRDQAPVGLGKGLASLDAKKQKAKAKVAA